MQRIANTCATAITRAFSRRKATAFLPRQSVRTVVRPASSADPVPRATQLAARRERDHECADHDPILGVGRPTSLPETQ